MKKFERIFLYSVLAILVFYVFLVDENVESQVAIQEEILAKRIAIVNDAGQEVVLLSTSEDDNGAIVIYNKNGTPVAYMGADEYGGIMGVSDKDGDFVAYMGASDEDNGEITVFNKSGKVIGTLP